jgi:hypothetical protein
VSPLWIKQNTKKYKFMPSPADQSTFFKYFSQIKKYLQTSVKGIAWFASLTESSQMKGSMTVEAAFVLPVVLSFFLYLMSVMEMLRLHGGLEAALWNVGNQLTLYCETFEEQVEVLPETVVSYVAVHSGIKNFLGTEYLEESPMVYGTAGLNYLRSDYLEEENCIDIVITYQVEPALSLFPFPYRRVYNRYYARCWSGYDVSNPKNVVKYVYVTSGGEVWHATPDCSYIYHQVEQMTKEWIGKKKNIRGYVYELCSFCGDETRGRYVYFTEEGEKYHNLKNCSAIYKNILAIEWQEALPYRACSRCVAEE